MYNYTRGCLHQGISLKGWVQNELQLAFILCGACTPLPVYLEGCHGEVATNGPHDSTISLLSFLPEPIAM